MALCCPGRTSSPHRTKSFIQQELYSDTGASLQGWLDLGTKPVLAFARTSPLDPRKTRQVSGHSSGFSHSAVFSFLSPQHHPLLFLIAFPSYRPSITLSSFLLLLSDLPPLCGVPVPITCLSFCVLQMPACMPITSSMPSTPGRQALWSLRYVCLSEAPGPQQLFL